MALAGFWLRGARGKLAGSVLQKSTDGRTMMRENVKPSNPKTQAQMIQRMIFATIAAAYSRMRSITDHSFEGTQYGSKSQQKFMRLNLQRLRAFYPTSSNPEALVETDLADIMAYATRGDAGDSGAGLIIAQGSLGSVPLIKNNGQAVGFGSAMTANTVKAVLEALGAEIGDQITICALVGNGVGVQFRKSRYVIDQNITEQQLAGTWSGDFVEGMDPDKTLLSDLRIVPSGNQGMIIPEVAGRVIIAAGLIISRRGIGDKWLRTNSILYNWLDEAPSYQVDYALPTWMYSGTDIETTNSRYLNNADPSGE